MQPNWRTIGEIAAVVSIVLSLLFVGYELRLSRTMAYDASVVANQESTASIRDLLASHGDLWQRGCAGEELTPGEQATFNNLIYAYSTNYFYLWRRTAVGVLQSDPEIYPINIARNMLYFPGFEHAWREVMSNSGAFNQQIQDSQFGWTAVVQEKFSELEQTEPRTARDPALCGF